MRNYVDPDKPCKVCNHRWDEHYEPPYSMNSYSRCRVVTSSWNQVTFDNLKIVQCPCTKYCEMPNLEYLEYLYDNKTTK